MDSASDSDASSHRPSPTRQLPQRAAKTRATAPSPPKRMTRSTATYFDSSPSDAGHDETDNASDHGRLSTLRTRRPKIESSQTSAGSRKRRPAVPPARHGGRQKRQRTQFSASSKRKPPAEAPPPSTLPGDWNAVPYLIWRNTFDYVAQPLRDPSAKVREVLKASKTLFSAAVASKLLAEPALTALYQCPALTPVRAHLLLRTLALPPRDTLFAYRPKVETLQIEVDSTLCKKNLGAYLDLGNLIRYLPRLRDLELYHQLDMPPYRSLDASVRWRYRDELFEALNRVPIGEPESATATDYLPLESWSWSSRLIPKSWSLDRLRQVHSAPSFSTLRKITFVNFQLPSMSAKTKDPAAMATMDFPVTQQLAQAISALPRLNHLVMESSTVANGALLERLPKDLEHLELINCWDVDAEHMSAFLQSHGYSLRTLVLKHCQSLNLGFLPVLGPACPSLTELRVDMTYFRHHEFYKDDNPNYEVLLDSDQIPTWPTTLQCIDLYHLRFGEKLGAASNFYLSLENSAAKLRHLRHLVIRGRLDTVMEERIRFRKYWQSRLEDVFKRLEAAPTAVASRRKASAGGADQGQNTARVTNTAGVRRSRRSTRLMDLVPSPVEEHDEVSAPISEREKARITRLAKEAKRLQMPSPSAESDADVDTDELADPAHNYASNRLSPVFHQRLCDVCIIDFDNKRPSERQFGMDDFLSGDDESSESEWNGEDEGFDD